VTLSVVQFRSTLENLGHPIRSALRQLAEPIADSQALAALSPIPVYASPKRITPKPIVKQVRQTGWRAVVMAGSKPVALLDLAKADRQPRLVSIRGRDAAKAFLGVLKKADRIAKTHRKSYQIRFVMFHPLFVTALWLSGRKSLFIPTRIDSKGRPRPKEYSEMQFLNLLTARDLKMHSHSAKFATKSKTVHRRKTRPRKH